MKSTLYYRVYNGKNPTSKKSQKQCCLTRRKVYDSEGVVDFGINLGYMRGKKQDLVGVVNGMIATVRELIKMGYIVDLDGWLLFYLALTGQVGEDLALTNKNKLRFRVRALKELKVSMDDFSFERIDDNGIKLSLSTITGEDCKVGVVKNHGLARINGRNCWMDEGDSVTVDIENESVECEVIDSFDDQINIKLPNFDKELLGKEYVFTVNSHCGVEDGPMQTKTIKAKIIENEEPYPLTIKKVTSTKLGREDAVKLWTDEVIAELSEVPEDATGGIRLVMNSTNEVVGEITTDSRNKFERLDDKHVKITVTANSTDATDGQWNDHVNYRSEFYLNSPTRGEVFRPIELA